MSRPEHIAPPEIFYNDDEAAKYATNTRMIDIQTKMAERAIEMLLLPERPCLVLDVGCGSGISGNVLEDMGHCWTGLDISRSMLDVAQTREEAPEGDMLLSDMGQGFKFRPGSFDGCISISAIQWLCNVDKSGHKPYNRLRAFFQSLFNCLAKGARAVLQFYPETPQQLEMITSAAMRSGFGGGVVVDFPHSAKAKKHFLVIYAGFFSVPQSLPKAIVDENEEAQRNTIKMSSKADIKKRKGKKQAKDRNWIMQKKERQRNQGKKVRMDSKFTGRQRKPIF